MKIRYNSGCIGFSCDTAIRLYFILYIINVFYKIYCIAVSHVCASVTVCVGGVGMYVCVSVCVCVCVCVFYFLISRKLTSDAFPGSGVPFFHI